MSLFSLALCCLHFILTSTHVTKSSLTKCSVILVWIWNCFKLNWWPFLWNIWVISSNIVYPITSTTRERRLRAKYPGVLGVIREQALRGGNMLITFHGREDSRKAAREVSWTAPLDNVAVAKPNRVPQETPRQLITSKDKSFIR